MREICTSGSVGAPEATPGLPDSRSGWRFLPSWVRAACQNHGLRLARALGTVSCPPVGADLRRSSWGARGKAPTYHREGERAATPNVTNLEKSFTFERAPKGG